MNLAFHEKETIRVPASASCVTFGPRGSFAVGSEDGCVRIYFPGSDSGTTVRSAIRGLKPGVSRIVFPKTRTRIEIHHPPTPEEVGADLGFNTVWVASGASVYAFAWASPTLMIQNHDEAVRKMDLGDEAEDEVNDFALNESETYMVFACDSGSMGVVNLGTMPSLCMKKHESEKGDAVSGFNVRGLELHKVKNAHNAICANVSFIHSRPNEFLSSGYDCAVRHSSFSFGEKTEGKELTRLDITPPTSTSDLSGGISLSPPFVHSLAVSSVDLIAAGTADGQIWFGVGGVKAGNESGIDFSGKSETELKPKNKRKQNRDKWYGLSKGKGKAFKVADGPVVGLAFIGPATLVSCTLLGTLFLHNLRPLDPSKDEGEGGGDQCPFEVVTTRVGETKCVEKVNALAVQTAHSCPAHRHPSEVFVEGIEVTVAIAGIDKENNKKGAIEFWKGKGKI